MMMMMTMWEGGIADGRTESERERDMVLFMLTRQTDQRQTREMLQPRARQRSKRAGTESAPKGAQDRGETDKAGRRRFMLLGAEQAHTESGRSIGGSEKFWHDLPCIFPIFHQPETTFALLQSLQLAHMQQQDQRSASHTTHIC